MSRENSSVVRLHFIKETELARLYKQVDREGKTLSTKWIPKSVCGTTTKFSDTEHEVEIEDWWLEKNDL